MYEHLTDAERTADARTLRRALDEARAEREIATRAAIRLRDEVSALNSKVWDYKFALRHRREELATLRADRDALRAAVEKLNIAALILIRTGDLNITHTGGEMQDIWDAREVMRKAANAQIEAADKWCADCQRQAALGEGEDHDWIVRRAAAFERHCVELHGADFEVCDDPQCRAVVAEEVRRGLLDAGDMWPPVEGE